VFQPDVKLTFVTRYCNPKLGWDVFVDIDASEHGRTGGARKKPESILREQQMRLDAERVEKALSSISVHVGQRRNRWVKVYGKDLPSVTGDRDIIAVHRETKRLLIVEVEGDSTGQPEQKLYKAIGQIVMACSECSLPEFASAFVIAVHGEEMRRHLRRATALEKIGVCGLHLAKEALEDDLVLRPEECWFASNWQPGLLPSPITLSKS
jgi:hypothetical protein